MGQGGLFASAPDYLRCGARYQTLADLDTTRESSPMSPAARTAATSLSGIAGNRFDDRFVLLDDETDMPLPNTAYAIVRARGDTEFGITDADGHTHVLASTGQAELVDIYV